MMEIALSLQDKLDALKAQSGSKIPEELRPILGRTIQGLIASGQAGRALKAGDVAPTFSLADQDGAMVSSTDLLKRGPIVTSFYRGVWCPFCNLELKALEEALPEIKARGAALVAISQQKPVNSRKSQRDNQLTFPILSDHGGDIGAAFGIRWVIPDDMREVHKKLGGPIPAFNGEDSWTLPMPARYVIGLDGVIAYAEINPDYTHRPDPSELYPTLDRLKQAVEA